MSTVVFMDAEIVPHRALSPWGMSLLLAILVGVNGSLALLFFIVGPRPLAYFMAGDAIILLVAFGASTRRSGDLEHIQVSSTEVRVTRRGRKGAETVWTSPTAQTRVAFIDHRGGSGDLRLWLSGQEVAIARNLSRLERVAFADSLERAIRRARRTQGAQGAQGPPPAHLAAPEPATG